jgi:hypothetical protein
MGEMDQKLLPRGNMPEKEFGFPVSDLSTTFP